MMEKVEYKNDNKIINEVGDCVENIVDEALEAIDDAVFEGFCFLSTLFI